MISRDTPGRHQVCGSFLFSIQTLQVGDPKGRGWDLAPASLMPCVCSGCCTHQDKLLPSLKVLYNAWQLTSAPEAEHIFHKAFGRRSAWFLACRDSVCRTQTHNTSGSEDQQSPVQHLVPPRGTIRDTSGLSRAHLGLSCHAPFMSQASVEKHSPSPLPRTRAASSFSCTKGKGHCCCSLCTLMQKPAHLKSLWSAPVSL